MVSSLPPYPCRFLLFNDHSLQCDKIAGLFFNIRPFTSMKICPKVFKICQSRLKILRSNKWTLERLSKTFGILPKWQAFAKSGHAASFPFLITLNYVFNFLSTCLVSYLGSVSSTHSSVTRFGEISPLWQNFKSLWAIFKKLYLVFDKKIAYSG